MPFGNILSYFLAVQLTDAMRHVSLTAVERGFLLTSTYCFQ